MNLPKTSNDRTKWIGEFCNLTGCNEEVAANFLDALFRVHLQAPNVAFSDMLFAALTGSLNKLAEEIIKQQQQQKAYYGWETSGWQITSTSGSISGWELVPPIIFTPGKEKSK